MLAFGFEAEVVKRSSLLLAHGKSIKVNELTGTSISKYGRIEHVLDHMAA